MKNSVAVIIFFISCLTGSKLQSQELAKNNIKVAADATQGAFPLVHSAKASIVFIDAQDAEVVGIAAEALARDVERVTSVKPEVKSSSSWKDISGYPVIIGTVGQSALIAQLAERKALNISQIKGKWESYSITVVEKPFDGVDKALVIAGSDRRGAAFGVFELSRRLGVSPWYWWADVKPRHQDNLFITAGALVQGPPTVKYRGIFLNDEDWGLQPWAARSMDKDIKDIGPNTYARIFELLLRLKANLIWPAMHPSTKAFFHYPANAAVADAYAIVVGTSHAEPMLRNNVDEWDEKTMGDFDYFSNKQAVQEYWEKRVKEAKDMEAVYTMGMRGVHDSGMEGAKNASEAAAMLEKIIADQREMLEKHVNKNIAAVPQAFTAYKEVLDIYDQGLKLPEDITIVWPDDNYGYIHRLSNPQEQCRSGGSGVYYHASYWGRPHDYLWLSSTHPALIREEMMKAYNMKADRLWVLNVGDIKPLEYNISLFLDMAYDATAFQESSAVKKHLHQWVEETFGEAKSGPITKVLWEYYDLAFERRPEFMGWSRTEPTTPTKLTAYNHFYFGDEAQKRIDKYETLEKQVKELRSQLPAKDADAFYQLVYYPVVGASLINKKFLYRDKSYLYARQNRTSASDYARLSRQAYEGIVEETNYYNQQLANGKWNGIMSMKPRDLPVYQEPELPEINIDGSKKWSIAPEGFVTADSSLISAQRLALPAFNEWSRQEYFVDLFLTGNQAVSWKATASDKWIKLSEQRGKLTPTFGQKQQRIWVSIDWSKVPKRAESTGHITFKGAGKVFKVEVKASNAAESDLAAYEGFVESNGYVSIFAEDYSRKTDRQAKGWKLVEDLGHTGKSLMALPLQIAPVKETAGVKENAPYVAYDFYTLTAAAPTITVSTLPTHPVTSDYSLRYAVSIDDGPVEVVDFRTFGRSDEWKQNVLRNAAERQVKYGHLNRGKHTLKIYMIDPGVVFDSIIIDLGGMKQAYSTIPETLNQAHGKFYTY
ncbi:glycosyl hydrolase 115 family protein [Pontibacter sp. 172403-2]|uniref:glycosyl hydrolase 115 family protein n=1 Tax=Pontibacter rufus TaxID=2791028 RepID=UPI0018B005C2|nr:glycosyl hydrolase 115 family protein [Pontibacter sp. 172403-2]MBF9251676.1 glycosyl hydrolase 115 family protein [Pontibacter sp. 172403-2]